MKTETILIAAALVYWLVIKPKMDAADSTNAIKSSGEKGTSAATGAAGRIVDTIERWF